MINYYDNSCATFNREYLVLCGDINPNPGPNQSKCLVCHRGLANNHRQVQCACSSGLAHIKCAGFTPKEVKYLSHSLVYECSACINRKLLTQLPFADEIEQNCSLNNLDTEPDSTWESYDLLIAQKYRNNIKMGHINANGIRGIQIS